MDKEKGTRVRMERDEEKRKKNIVSGKNGAGMERERNRGGECGIKREAEGGFKSRVNCKPPGQQFRG